MAKNKAGSQRDRYNISENNPTGKRWDMIYETKLAYYTTNKEIKSQFCHIE